MRRIFTSTIFVAAFAVISLNSFGQTCNQNTINPSPSPAYGSTLPVQTSAIPGNDFNSSNQSTLGTYNLNSTTELTSPILHYVTGPQTAVYFKYHLTSGTNNQTASPSQYSITLIYGNPQQTVTCGLTAWTAGAIPSGNSGGADYYFWISNVSWPANRNFRIRLTITTDNRNIIATAFQSNAQPPTGAAVLPVKFSTLDARVANSSVSLKWMVATEENLAGYEIEKGTDGRSFSKIGFVNASGESTYSFVDTKPSSISYYRIKSVDINGRYGYSSIALVKAGKAMIVIKAFPTPFIKNISIQHPTADAGSAITISSQDGRIIKSIIPAAGTQQTDVDLSSANAGLYLIRYKNGNGEVEILKILKQQ
jgi:hypothetical protein